MFPNVVATMTPYQRGRATARWHIWCFLDDMENKYPMTGKRVPDAAFKNGWYDMAYELRQRLKRIKP